MESSKDGSRYYENIIWLLLTSHNEDTYLPSQFIIDSIKPRIKEASKDLEIFILDSTKYDLKITKGFVDYLDLFKDKISLFERSLVVLSYVNETYVKRDCYVAKITNELSCWDTAYINYKGSSDLSHYFTFTVRDSELPDKLEKILWQQKDL